jgi:flagellar basal-body rod modification protein FlgD
MAGIGNPNGPSQNPFKDISMKKSTRSNNQKKKNVGKELNNLAGVAQKSEFADAKTHNQLDKDAFLKLLSNQLANQDPFKPVDQKKFAADLAQFSQLEQLANMNSKLDTAFGDAGQEKKFMGASFIGKSVQTSGTSVDHNGENRPIDLPFFLPKPAKVVMIRVLDEANNIVKQIDLDGLGKGAQSVTWDGMQADGVVAVKGSYRFQVTGWDETYNEFKGETRAKGIVDGVSFENGETVLSLSSGKKVFLRDVHSFSSPTVMRDAANSPALKQQASSAYNKNNEGIIKH